MEKILIGDSYPKHYIREPGSNLCTCHFYLIPFCTKEKKIFMYFYGVIKI